MPAMTAVAKEMLELAEKMRARRNLMKRLSTAIVLSVRELELAEIALRESALSRNEVVNARLI